MKPRIIVTGANGRLGAALVREWRAAGLNVTGFGRNELDLASGAAITERLNSEDFAALVNCAAQTNVDRCETEIDEAFTLNAEAPTIIADACRRKGARMIHISTDYVFDGAKDGAYTEDDPAIPISIYGASKRAGESGVLAATEGKALVARVSWVFGPDRPSFVDQIVKNAMEKDEVAAIADKVAVPTYTLDAAAMLKPFLFENHASGLLHLCNAGSCTWQEYGQWALDCAAEAGAALKARSVAPLKMADLKAFIARRPPNTAMSTARLTTLTGIHPRPWRDAVREYIAGRIQASKTSAQ
ncbi:MAG: dTDP-4-dehydrorhamnose reductase [Verrucomicrobiota bacterium]|jgi:dTDP-4-dehydrorhamnose reductase